MEAQRTVTRAIVKAGQLIVQYGTEAAAEAALRVIDCTVAGHMEEAEFWLTVEREAMDALIAIQTPNA